MGQHKQNLAIEKITQRCEDLYRDLDLNYVKQWKEENSAKAIGFMPVYVPRELIHAAGMLPVGIMGGGDALEIIRGDAYFQSYICHIPRSTIELGLSGKLDCVEGMLFPAICDVIRNLSGMWKIMFEDKYVKYVDLPQSFHQAGDMFYRAELDEMREAFEKISGNKITTERLNRSIELYNENRKALEDLYGLRAEAPQLVTTNELYLIMRASNILEVTEHTALVRSYLQAVQKEKRPKRDNIRVIVTGAFCEQPPLTLIRALEGSGCYIVEDDWVLGARYLLKPVAITEDPIGALTKSYLNDCVTTASRYEETAEKGAYLVQRVRELEAEGVIFCAPSFCDPALLEQPMLQGALSREKIAFTAFKYSENTGQIQVIKEQAGTFADSIKLWDTP